MEKQQDANKSLKPKTPKQIKCKLTRETTTGEQSEIEAVILIPGRALVNQACELAKVYEANGDESAGTEAEGHLLRLCLKQLDGKSLNYNALEGVAIDRLLRPSEQALLSDLIQRQTTASPSQVKASLAQSEIVFDDECHKRGLHKRKIKLLDDEREAILIVPNRRIMRMCMEQAKMYRERSALIEVFERLYNMVRWCLCSLDGYEFDRSKGPAAELRGDGLDDYLTPKEYSLIALVLDSLANPSTEASASFLSSVEVIEIEQES